MTSRDLKAVNSEILTPALKLLPLKMDTLQARLMLLAIGWQESKFATRVQYGNGPAHSYWQIEKGGGIAGVLGSPIVAPLLTAAAIARDLTVTGSSIWQAMTKDDVLGALTARLILWCDPHALPAYGDESGAWECYLRNWRPGMPRPADWTESYTNALKAFR